MPTNQKKLFQACDNGNVKAVKKLLKLNDVDVNQVNERDETPLYKACYGNHLKTVQALLACDDTAVNQAGKACWTPLHLASYLGQLKAVKVFLAHPKIAINQADRFGRTSLHLACQRNQFKVVQALLAGGVDVNQANDNGNTPLYIACKGGYLKLVQAFLAHGADVNQANGNGWRLLHSACMQGHLALVQFLLANGSNVNQTSDDGWTPLYLAFLNRHVKVIQVLLAHGADVNEAIDKGRTLLTYACVGEHFKVVQALLADPRIDVNQADENGRAPLNLVCFKGSLKVVQTLLAAPNIDVNQADENGKTSLHIACLGVHLKAVQALLAAPKLDVNQADKTGMTPLYQACLGGHRSFVQAIWDHQDVKVDARSYEHIEAHQGEYGDIVDPFTKDYLATLRQEIDNNPGMLFDFPDDEGHPDTERALIGYYVLRHLIRCSEVNDLSQLANDVDIPSSIELLLNIPSVKALVVANVISRELPANYLRLGSRYFARQANELLRLAQSVGNEAIAARLLEIPAIREAAEANNFYQGVHGVNLAQVAHDRESSMRALTPEEQESVKRIQKEYKETIQAQGGVSKVIESLKLTLIEKYLADDASSTVTLNGEVYPLPFEWDDLQQFIQDHDCTREQQEKIAQIYYQNSYHTAYRYLSKPNRWMAEDAGWVYISEDREECWSTFEEYLPLIAYLWTAANDDAQPPVEANVTVEDRMNLFIRQIALLNRSHNWDEYRPVLDELGKEQFDEDGNLIQEEYDDLTGDKPSCFSGVKKRLFQSLLHHPLYTPLNKNLTKQFVNESIRAYYQNLLFSYEKKILETLIEAVDEYFISFAEHPLIDGLLLPENYAEEVKEALAARYGQKRGALFFPTVDALLNQEGLIANDFLRFYQSAGLGQLLEKAVDIAHELQPLREIVDTMAVDYLFQRAEPMTVKKFVEFNRLVRDIQLYGVGFIWDKIEADVKVRYLALPDDNANEENWANFVGTMKTIHLSIKAKKFIQGELFRIVRISPGYRAHHNKGGEGGSQSSFWSVPVRQREKAWTLMDCVLAAAKKHDEASTSSEERKAEVARLLLAWRGLDKDDLAKEVYQYLKEGHGGWSKNSFKAQLGWHVFNKLDGEGLKGKQTKILNKAPISGEKIRHHCNYFWSTSHREQSLNQLLCAFSTEFPGADVVPRRAIRLI